MRTVRGPSWPMATARLKARVVFPTPPLGAKTVTIRADPSARGGGRLVHALDAVTSSYPVNGMARTAWTPLSGRGGPAAGARSAR